MDDLVYEVWILGYNEDGSVNDFEQLIATFQEEEQAKWFALTYPFSKPTLTPKANVVVEEVDNGRCTFVITETEIY